MLGSTLLTESFGGYDGSITTKRKDVGRMRGNLAYVDDRALTVVDTSYERRSRRFIGCGSSRWVSSCQARGYTF
jgi:hypothetical protein